MEIVKQTPGKLVIVHRNGRVMRLFAAAGAAVFVGLSGMFASVLIGGIRRGAGAEIIIGALMLPFALVPVVLCLNVLLTKYVLDFDRDLDRFSIRERSLFGRAERAGRVSRIVSIDHKLDYSITSVDTGPASEIAIRYDDGAGSATKTVTFGLGMQDEDRLLQQILRSFLKL